MGLRHRTFEGTQLSHRGAVLSAPQPWCPAAHHSLAPLCPLTWGCLSGPVVGGGQTFGGSAGLTRVLLKLLLTVSDHSKWIPSPSLQGTVCVAGWGQERECEELLAKASGGGGLLNASDRLATQGSHTGWDRAAGTGGNCPVVGETVRQTERQPSNNRSRWDGPTGLLTPPIPSPGPCVPHAWDTLPLSACTAHSAPHSLRHLPHHPWVRRPRSPRLSSLCDCSSRAFPACRSVFLVEVVISSTRM